MNKAHIASDKIFNRFIETMIIDIDAHSSYSLSIYVLIYRILGCKFEDADTEGNALGIRQEDSWGFLNSGGCPGTAAGIRLIQFKLWNAPMGELPTKIHLGNCLANNCPYRDTLRPMIEN
jgi:predicted metal-binding protein